MNFVAQQIPNSIITSSNRTNTIFCKLNILFFIIFNNNWMILNAWASTIKPQSYGQLFEYAYWIANSYQRLEFYSKHYRFTHQHRKSVFRTIFQQLPIFIRFHEIRRTIETEIYANIYRQSPTNIAVQHDYSIVSINY